MEEELKNLRKICSEVLNISIEDVEECCSGGISPFYVLAAMNRHQEIKMILDKKEPSRRLDINQKTVMDGDTALHVAVLGDNEEMIDVLVNGGADFSIQNKRGQTPFLLALSRGKSNTVDELWKSYQSRFDLNTTDSDGNTALHLAAERNMHNCVQNLLVAGADVNVVNDVGQTALNISACHGDLKSVKKLVHYGASILKDSKTKNSAVLLAVTHNHTEVAHFLLSKLDPSSVEVLVASLVQNIRMLSHVSRDYTLNFLAQLCLACAVKDNTVDTLLKFKVVSTWMSVLKHLVISETESCEPAFCCLAQMMLEVDKAEGFIREFISCGGPDITVGMLEIFSESKRGSVVIAAFCMLLPLCTVPKGQKWLRSNYHKIVECYQFFDSTNEWYVSFHNMACKKVLEVWDRFKLAFDSIQETESKRHEAELLADEERERVKRERKAERRKKKETKRISQDKLKENNASPNLRTVKTAAEWTADRMETIKSPEKDPSLEPKKLKFEKVMSKKEMKMNKKKSQNVKKESTAEIMAKVKRLKCQEGDDTMLNFRPNRGKAPGENCNNNASGGKGMPNDLPWKNAKNTAKNTSSPGKDFPKLRKQKLAGMLKETENGNDQTTAMQNKRNKELRAQTSAKLKQNLPKHPENNETMKTFDSAESTGHKNAENIEDGFKQRVDESMNRDPQVASPEKTFVDIFALVRAGLGGAVCSDSDRDDLLTPGDEAVLQDGQQAAVGKVVSNAAKPKEHLTVYQESPDQSEGTNKTKRKSNCEAELINPTKNEIRELKACRNTNEVSKSPSKNATHKVEKKPVAGQQQQQGSKKAAQIYYPKGEDIQATLRIDGKLSHICVSDETDENHAVPVSVVSSVSTDLVIGLVPESPSKPRKSAENPLQSDAPYSPLKSGKVYYPKEEVIAAHVKAGDKFEYLYLDQGAKGKKVVPVKVMHTDKGEKKYIALTVVHNEKGEKKYQEPLKRTDAGFVSPSSAVRCNLFSNRLPSERDLNFTVQKTQSQEAKPEPRAPRNESLDRQGLGTSNPATHPTSRVNKKRSRATTTGPRDVPSNPGHLSPLGVLPEMITDNGRRSNLERFMRRENENSLMQMYSFQGNTNSSGTETYPNGTEATETPGATKELVDPITNGNFEFLSECRLKSTGSIKADSQPSSQVLEFDTTDVEFGFLSSGSTSVGSFNTSTEWMNSLAVKPTVGILKEVNSDITMCDTLEQKPQGMLDSRVIECQMQQENQMTRSEKELLEKETCVGQSEDKNNVNSSKAKKIEIYRTPGKPCRFGAIGEPCPVQPPGSNPGSPYYVEASSKEKLFDADRLRLGDGDCLHNDGLSPSEVFGPRKHWKEPGHCGLGWLDGLSQLMSAQIDYAENGGSFAQIFQTYPVFGKGADYEPFKKKQIESIWQRSQTSVFPSTSRFTSIWSCGDSVQMDQDKANSLLPQHLLDSPTESEKEEKERCRPRLLDANNNKPFGTNTGQQEPCFMERIQEECETFPSNQVAQENIFVPPQPAIPVIGHASTVMPAHRPYFSGAKFSALYTESNLTQRQTGQGDSYYIPDAFATVASRHLGPVGALPQGEPPKPEPTKTRSVPFLSVCATRAVMDATKKPMPSSYTHIPTEYLSESSDRSSLTSTTISTINSFKSAKELVCSRSDVSIACERLNESFIIGKGRFGTIYESWTRDGQLVAIRRVKIQIFDTIEQQLYRCIVSKVTHRNVCKLLELKRNEQFGFVVIERLRENLKHFVTRTRAQGFHPLQHLISMCRGVIHGLAYLHQRNIHHGRLCPENVLLAENDSVKLSDYGLPTNTTPAYQTTEFPDDPKSIWLCSERLLCGCPDEARVVQDVCKADIQVAGMLIHYTLTLGDHPFGRCLEEILENLSRRPVNVKPFGEELDDVLPKMLSILPEHRPSAESVRLHPFFWTDTEKFRFLVNVGHHLYRSKESKNEVSATLERCINDLNAANAKQPWLGFIQTSLVQEVTSLMPWIAFRMNVGGLLSFMECVDTYQHLLSAGTQKLLGGAPEVYFLTRFPALPIRVHQLVRVLERQLPVCLYPNIDC